MSVALGFVLGFIVAISLVRLSNAPPEFWEDWNWLKFWKRRV